MNKDYKAQMTDIIYGKWRDGEKVEYEISANRMKVIVSTNTARATFTVKYYPPTVERKDKFKGGSPFLICMHPIGPIEYANFKGYAVFVMDSYEIASDDINRKGAFYELYPYTIDRDGQTGVLMAWAWGASKVLDAVIVGAYKDLGLNPELSLVTGVSRWGKATAVLGAYDHRFKMVIPTCSGAGGLALYSYKSEGKTYDLTEFGGPSSYTYEKNEPLEVLQSDSERGWFVDAFLDYKKEEDLPFDQDILPKLAAAKDSAYFIIAAHTGEDWVNAPSMWQCYLKAKEYYEKEGLGDRLFAHFHLKGHAVLEEDLVKVFEAFENLYTTKDEKVMPFIVNIPSRFENLVGNTPLLKLENLMKECGAKAEIVAKLEYFNPAGSAKDRVGLNLINDAEKRGLLKPGATIIEPTSGNTGIGLAAVAATRGYRCIIVMPDSMSEERKKLMGAYGAELVLTDGALGMKGSIEKANELAQQIPGSFIPGQFENPANAEAHMNTTGPEIYSDLFGQLDYFVAGIGTGGTITGVGEYLKKKNPDIKIIGVEPASSPLLTRGKAGSHKLQGIGANFVPKVLNREILSSVCDVSDEDAYEMVRLMGKKEGILVGISSGAALYAAVKLSKQADNEGKRIVVLLPDAGDRYLSTPDLF